jgi:hypothetical protein
VKNEVSEKAKEERNILHTTKRWKANSVVIYRVGAAFSNMLLKER